MNTENPSHLNRRRFVCGSTAATIASLQAGFALAEEKAKQGGVAGKVNHSACKWCYRNITLEQLCEAGKEFGLRSVELLQPDDFATLKKYDMHCAMVSFPSGEGEADGKKVKIGGIPHAFNRVENHDTLVEIYEPHLKAAKEAGFTNVICFSGNRRGLDDETGLKNCATGLKRLMPLCEKLGVTLSMELLNSKVNHKDYQCDRSDWGVALCEEVGSERFKLLYDIYHMQIMEGDIIATIGKHHGCFKHYHTAGVPGRNEIGDQQELHYPAICRAIRDTGFKGYLAQEFTPAAPDPVASLREAIRLCDV